MGISVKCFLTVKNKPNNPKSNVKTRKLKIGLDSANVWKPLISKTYGKTRKDTQMLSRMFKRMG